MNNKVKEILIFLKNILEKFQIWVLEKFLSKSTLSEFSRFKKLEFLTFFENESHLRILKKIELSNLILETLYSLVFMFVFLAFYNNVVKNSFLLILLLCVGLTAFLSLIRLPIQFIYFLICGFVPMIKVIRKIFSNLYLLILLGAETGYPTALLIEILRIDTNKKIWSVIFESQLLNSKEITEFWYIVVLNMIILTVLMYFYIQRISIFEVEDIIDINAIIITLLSIVTFVISIEINEINPLGIFLLLLIFQTACISWFADVRIRKSNTIAQEIFQEQLLLEKPRYKELKKCYYHGGEKYKEKLLSTEKFLRLIKKREKYLIRRDKNNRYSYKSGFNPQNSISPTRNCLP